MSEPDHPSPHDALFKRAFTEMHNAAGLLRAVLPRELVDRVDWSTLELFETSQIDEKLRDRRSDLLFRARVGRGEVLFYLLVEHQSSCDPLMAWRLWRYVAGIWDLWMRGEPRPKRLPRIIPVVVYHGEHPWSAARDIAELLEDEPSFELELAPLIPRFTYLVDDLTAAAPEAIRARGLPAFAALVLWALRSAPRRTFAETVGLFRDLFDEVLAGRGGAEALATLLRYLSIVTRDEDTIVDDVLAHLSEPVREEAMSYYDRLIQQGEEKGRAEGRAEGRRDLVRKQLTLKFGAPDARVQDRLAKASLEELDAMGERILTAATIEDVLG